MTAFSWVPFYVTDWLLSSARRKMTRDQREIYLEMLFQQWYLGGYLPNDLTELAELTSCASAEEFESIDANHLVRDQFVEEAAGRRLFNPKMLQECQDQVRRREQASQAGKRGNDARWNGNHRNPITDQNRKAIAIQDIQDIQDIQLFRVPKNGTPVGSEAETGTTDAEIDSSIFGVKCRLSPDVRSQLISLQRRVFQYYLEKTNRNPIAYQFTEQRRLKSGHRIMELYNRVGNDIDKTERGFRYAVDRLSESPWHNGQNPSGKSYNDYIRNLCKSPEEFEKWLNS